MLVLKKKTAELLAAAVAQKFGDGLLSADEMMESLSWVRLGAVYSLVDIKPQTVNSLFVTMQPATLNVLAGAKLTQVQADEIRARIVREKLYSK